MVNRIATWAIVVWTALMAIGIFAAFRGIGGDCATLTGNELVACQSDAWIRGGVGISLLLLLWFVVAAPMAIAWFVTRPRDNVIVFGPNGQQVMVSEAEARRRVEAGGWTYQRPIASEVPLR